MNNMISQGFTQGENYLKSSLTLKDSCSMIFVLPNEGTSIKELTSSARNLQKIFEAETTDSGMVTWKVPKMDFSSSFDLNETLKSLGLNTAFLEGKANFKGMTQTELFISLVKQETRIIMDEDGVTAAAFTQIDMKTTSMPTGSADMILDRPFLYAITASDGSLLFMGSYDLP